MQTFTLPTPTDGITVDDLRALTNQMIDMMQDMIKDCTDKDVTFEPSDPEAYDSAAVSEDELRIAWTLGHVIVHATASSEEAASPRPSWRVVSSGTDARAAKCTGTPSLLSSSAATDSKRAPACASPAST